MSSYKEIIKAVEEELKEKKPYKKKVEKIRWIVGNAY